MHESHPRRLYRRNLSPVLKRLPYRNEHEAVPRNNHCNYLRQRATLYRTTQERTKLAKQMQKLVQMRLDGELSKESFMPHHQPLELQLAQIDEQLPQLKADYDFQRIQLLSADTVLTEALALFDRGQKMSFVNKRAIVETITKAMIIGTEDITNTLAYQPTLSQYAEVI